MSESCRLPLPAAKAREFRVEAFFDGARNVFGCGVGVFVTNEAAHPGCVLLGKRKGATGAGTWALPGGHLEFGETLEACGARELLEETGIAETTGASVVCWDNAVDVDAGYHYVIGFVQLDTAQEPATMEPDKCEGWFWVRWSGEVLNDAEELAFPPTGELCLGLRNVRERGFSPFT